MRRPLTGAAALLLAGAALATPTTPTDASVPILDRTPAHRVRAPAPTSWGPTRAEVRHARDLVRALPLAQLAGQVIVAGYHGTGSPAALVSRLHLGGAVPVAENITSSTQIRAVNASVRRAVRGRGYRQGLGLGHGTRVVLASRGRPARAGVLVALDRPDLLARSTAPVRVATYGSTPGVMDALVGFLLGTRPAPGKLPVRVPSVPRTGC